jgi:L-ribulose-5-phosphate 3-epimerase
MERKFNRRAMLVGGAKAAAALALTASCRSTPEGPVGQAPKPKPRPTVLTEGFKLGVCDWTIGKATNPESLALAKRIGLDGVQVDFGSGNEDLPLFNPELQKKFLEEAKKQQMEIASLAMGTLNGVPYKSDPRAEKWVEKGIDVCLAMNVKIVLLAFFGNGDLRDDPKGVDAVVERLKRVAPKAEDAGVALGFESWLSAEQHIEILERVGSPALRVYYDVGNSDKMGYDIFGEIRLLGGRICQFHAKDYANLYGMGTIGFKDVRRAIDDIGYRGWIVMEGTKMPLGVEESCRYDAKYLRMIFPRMIETPV